MSLFTNSVKAAVTFVKLDLTFTDRNLLLTQHGDYSVCVTREEKDYTNLVLRSSVGGERL